MVGPGRAPLDSGQPPVRRHLAELPQGRKAARAGELCRVCGGPLVARGGTLHSDLPVVGCRG